jgi:hypothetical protein
LLPFRVGYLLPHEPLAHKGPDDPLRVLPGLVLGHGLLRRGVGFEGGEIGGVPVPVSLVEQGHLIGGDEAPQGRVRGAALGVHVVYEVLEPVVEIRIFFWDIIVTHILSPFKNTVFRNMAPGVRAVAPAVRAVAPVIRAVASGVRALAPEVMCAVDRRSAGGRLRTSRTSLFMLHSSFFIFLHSVQPFAAVRLAAEPVHGYPAPIALSGVFV